ncbi:unnamed protein product, partial [Amoebophrya sp. A25]
IASPSSSSSSGRGTLQSPALQPSGYGGGSCSAIKKGPQSGGASLLSSPCGRARQLSAARDRRSQSPGFTVRVNNTGVPVQSSTASSRQPSLSGRYLEPPAIAKQGHDHSSSRGSSHERTTVRDKIQAFEKKASPRWNSSTKITSPAVPVMPTSAVGAPWSKNAPASSSTDFARSARQTAGAGRSTGFRLQGGDGMMTLSSFLQPPDRIVGTKGRSTSPAAGPVRARWPPATDRAERIPSVGSTRRSEAASSASSASGPGRAASRSSSCNNGGRLLSGRSRLAPPGPAATASPPFRPPPRNSSRGSASKCLPSTSLAIKAYGATQNRAISSTASSSHTTVIPGPSTYSGCSSLGDKISTTHPGGQQQRGGGTSSFRSLHAPRQHDARSSSVRAKRGVSSSQLSPVLSKRTDGMNSSTSSSGGIKS